MFHWDILTVTGLVPLQLYKFNKEQDYILYSNKIDIVDFLKDNSPIKFYRLSLLDFKKFIKFKKKLTNKKTPQAPP
jgi:hypothetical protein